MNRQDTTAKVQTVEAGLKRWHSRLTRAANMVAKLEKKRRRLLLEKMSEGRPVIATVKVKKQIETDHMSEADFEKFANKPTIDIAEVQRQVDAAIATVTPQAIADVAAVVHKKKEEKGIPSFLDRSDPLIAEKMLKARKLAEAEERKKMPLSGKAARDYIKRKK